MNSIKERLVQMGIEIPEILLPREAALGQWAVIACDQFTQDRLYWEKVRELTADAPSTLNLIFPEVFLADNKPAGRIADIHRAMRKYLDTGVFAAPRQGFVYLERDTPYQRGRSGLVAAVDLEQYDWSPRDPKDTTPLPLIRSTEGTVPERLPPRMDIRREAPLETPHILLLIDDDTDTLLRGLGERAKKNAPAYQGELMLNSGSVSGWFLDSPDDWAVLATGLEDLVRRALTRYDGGAAMPPWGTQPASAPQPGFASQPASVSQPFLFAVGDGNHSLASAKGIWEEYKVKHGNDPNPPCRYAMVEIENIYDPAICFEPIHRVVFGMGFEETIALLATLPDFFCRKITSREELVRLTAEPVNGNRFGMVSGGRYALLETSATGISTASLQPLLDKAVCGNSALSVDYIHGEDELFRISETPGKPVTGILLPPVQKAGFFETVARHGPLPRKSFSMGEAWEKRFYIECRRLFG
jgi:hypothetical protein